MLALSGFNPKIHICKFGFELYDYAGVFPYLYKILGNLYQMEISVIFLAKQSNEVIDTIGIKISQQRLNALLPLIMMDDFEKLRDKPEPAEWKLEKGVNGYRDGWGYHFWCLSESGMPLLQTYMSDTYKVDMMPPDERLLHFIKMNYNRKKHNRLKW